MKDVPPARRYKRPQSRLNRCAEAVLLVGIVLVGLGGFFDGRCLLVGAAMMLSGGVVAAKTDQRTPEEILRDMPESY